MGIELNHTIVQSHDQRAEARFFTTVLGLPEPATFSHFDVVEMRNGVSLDFMNVEGDIASQHYAFLISEDEFDAVSARLSERGVPTWADPMRQRAGSNTNDGGRGLYFDSPAGHNLEVLTRPYGSGAA